ncbi:ferrochelatase [Streptococcus oralis]|uniref:ferrochelatase n=1 Tax=Streptococcus oralis TaxID=1303 RepID=UPI0009C0BAFE
MIVAILGLTENQYTNMWQSKSATGLPWIKPSVLDHHRYKTGHSDHYIVLPIVFISEHLEVLLRR